MELYLLLTAGVMGGLLASLVMSLVWRAQNIQDTQTQVLFYLLHALWGAGLGLLFWISWGFTALVNVPWWQRGLVFGLLCSGVQCIPLGLLKLLLDWSWRTLMTTTLNICCTSVMCGLLCAWRWTHG